MAGGVNGFGSKETGSFRLDWDAVVESQPEMIILMLCGYTAQRALEDLPILAAKPGWDDLPAGRHNQISAIDAGAYTSRSGPRLVQGLEIIAEILHPELFSGCIPADGAVRVDSTLARIGYVRAGLWGKAQQARLGLDYTLGIDKQCRRSVAESTLRAPAAEGMSATCAGEVVGDTAVLATQPC